MPLRTEIIFEEHVVLGGGRPISRLAEFEHQAASPHQGDLQGPKAVPSGWGIGDSRVFAPWKEESGLGGHRASERRCGVDQFTSAALTRHWFDRKTPGHLQSTWCNYCSCVLLHDADSHSTGQCHVVRLLPRRCVNRASAGVLLGDEALHEHLSAGPFSCQHAGLHLGRSGSSRNR
jgi:hypothetical protein